MPCSPTKPMIDAETMSLLLERISRQRKILVAVSGGCDSVTLLHCLKNAGYRRIVVGHFNHRLRGAASGGDARFVRALAQSHGCEVFIESATKSLTSQTRGLGLEAVAREARYKFLFTTARVQKCAGIFLGHHADDQAETVLWNILRGSGLRGAAGMQLFREREGLLLVRPLLRVTREEIERYANEHRQKYRHDAGNDGLDFTRNRLRHQLLPELRRVLGRNVRDPLLSFAKIAAEEDAFLEELARGAGLHELPELPVAALRDVAPPLRRRLLRKWLEARGVASAEFSVVERVLQMALGKGAPAKTNLPGGKHCRRQAGRVFIGA